MVSEAVQSIINTIVRVARIDAANCSIALLQNPVTDGILIPTAIQGTFKAFDGHIMMTNMIKNMINSQTAALSQQGRYINLSGARYDCLPKLPDLLRYGIEGSRKYQEEKNNPTLISTALEILLPRDPNEDEAYAIVPIGTSEVWCILQELKMVE